jgi:hypothetical protein
VRRTSSPSPIAVRTYIPGSTAAEPLAAPRSESSTCRCRRGSGRSRWTSLRRLGTGASLVVSVAASGAARYGVAAAARAAGVAPSPSAQASWRRERRIGRVVGICRCPPAPSPPGVGALAHYASAVVAVVVVVVAVAVAAGVVAVVAAVVARALRARSGEHVFRLDFSAHRADCPVVRPRPRGAVQPGPVTGLLAVAVAVVAAVAGLDIVCPGEQVHGLHLPPTEEAPVAGPGSAVWSAAERVGGGVAQRARLVALAALLLALLAQAARARPRWRAVVRARTAAVEQLLARPLEGCDRLPAARAEDLDLMPATALGDAAAEALEVAADRTAIA